MTVLPSPVPVNPSDGSISRAVVPPAALLLFARWRGLANWSLVDVDVRPHEDENRNCCYTEH